MLANLRALFAVVIDIILLRRGPEHLPASQPLLVVVVALSAIATALMGTATGLAWPDALLQTAVGSAVMLLWFYVALGMVNKRERFQQTMTALFGINMLFVPIMMPLLSAVMPYLEKNDASIPPPGGALLLLFVVGAWALIVEVRVIRAAFEVPGIVALLLVVGEFLAAGAIGSLLFGGAAKAA
jgi:hypothetical protein